MYKMMHVLAKRTLKKTIVFAAKYVPLGAGSVISDHFGKICPLCVKLGEG